ncbi:MAG: hypothetical protein WCI72_00130 [archaeon]
MAVNIENAARVLKEGDIVRYACDIRIKFGPLKRDQQFYGSYKAFNEASGVITFLPLPVINSRPEESRPATVHYSQLKSLELLAPTSTF